MSARKVLMTADALGGVWTYALELARGLGSERTEVTLATLGACLSPEQRQELQDIPHLHVMESDYRLEWMREPWDDVARAGEWLLEIERWVKPDVVHLNQFAWGSLPWNSPVLVVGHSCVLSWWRAVRGSDPPPEWNRYRQEVAGGLRAAGLVAAPSAAMLSELQLHYGPLPRTRVIPNGRGDTRFAPKDKRPFVFTVGRLWDAAKNVGALAEIAPRLHWPVYVAGEPEHPDGGTAELPHVRVLGCLGPAELARWLAHAAVFALPARYEPFGLSALEAGLAGCALVLGDIPSLREVWGDAAIFVPPDDPRALRVALDELAADVELRQRFSTAARDRALTFSHHRMAGDYARAYADLLDGRRERLPERRMRERRRNSGSTARPLGDRRRRERR